MANKKQRQTDGAVQKYKKEKSTTCVVLYLYKKKKHRFLGASGWGTRIRRLLRHFVPCILTGLAWSARLSPAINSPLDCLFNAATFSGPNPYKKENSTICVVLSVIEKRKSTDFSVLLAGVLGFEPRECWSQSPMPYRLAIPHR